MITIFEHPKIGRIEIRRRRNVFRRSFKILANKVVIVTNLADKSPFPLSQEIEQQILEMQAKFCPQAERFLLSEKGLHFSDFQVEIRKSTEIFDGFIARKTVNGMEILVRADYDLKAENVQKAMWRLIAKLLKSDAEQQLPNRLKELAKKYNFSYHFGKINTAKHRWGSCSSTKTINLSCFLLLLPPELVDFVLVHELCHTREMNHGERFKALMKSIFPNYAELEHKLKTLPIKPV